MGYLKKKMASMSPATASVSAPARQLAESYSGTNLGTPIQVDSMWVNAPGPDSPADSVGLRLIQDRNTFQWKKVRIWLPGNGSPPFQSPFSRRIASGLSMGSERRS